ncbi:LysE family transporter [Streptomyces sp. NPDC013953]|uniref:LysE family transporter n=1 Tax=Streptomyces sp. NPDC013953 TaxID=3364868 RepID=UPI0036FFFCF2
MWTTALAGAAAGLGVAMPLGAVGVLLVQEGMRDRRGAVAAASAVAVVDLGYAALATALGPLVSAALSGVEAWVRVVSAAVLLAIAMHGLWTSRHAGEPGAAERPRPGPATAPAPAPNGTAGDAGGEAVSRTAPRKAGTTAGPAGPADPTGPAAGRRTPTAARTFARFAGLTLVNPTTALYFAALTTAQGAALTGGAAGAVFVAGVFVASLAWQQLLVAASSFAGARISGTVRKWTFRAGYGLVAVYAAKVAPPLP